MRLTVGCRVAVAVDAVRCARAGAFVALGVTVAVADGVRVVLGVSVGLAVEVGDAGTNATTNAVDELFVLMRSGGLPVPEMTAVFAICPTTIVCAVSVKGTLAPASRVPIVQVLCD